MGYIFDHNRPAYQRLMALSGKSRNNGAFHYSCEIVKNIIPSIKTNRSWVTINSGECENGAIVFIHSNVEIEKNYAWLRNYNDLICVCSNKQTCKEIEMRGIGKAIYLPLSVDVAEIEKHKKPAHVLQACYAGNMYGWKQIDIRKYVPAGTQYLTDMSRNEFLERLSMYRVVYAIGRCAIEAKVLGCEVRTCDHRYPDPEMWQVLDNKDAAKMLQKELDKIDGKNGKNWKRTTKLIITTDHPMYIAKRGNLNGGQFNGAYYYSQEIVKNIIPNVKTSRPWDTLGMKSIGTFNDAIVFIHHCIQMEKVYDWLKNYENLVIVVSTPDCFKWATSEGYKTIYLPLSIDTEYVSQFKTKQTKDACFCGNIWAFRKQEIAETIPDGVDFQPPNICREDLLKFMAQYRNVYAIGRCALEARCLGANILQCYKKYTVEHWKLLDNKEAAAILQKELDKIDKPKRLRK